MSKKTVSQELKAKEAESQETTIQEIKLQETKKPANLRANVAPVDGFVLSVDRKLKTRYETSIEATAAASKLKQSYPVVQVAIYDAAARTYTPVELQQQET